MKKIKYIADIIINKSRIINNLLKIKRETQSKVCAMVKCDAYGLGGTAVSKILDNFADCLGVFEVAEGVKLKKAGIKSDIIVFGTALPKEIKYAKEHDLILTVHSYEEFKQIYLQTRVHILSDCGFNRGGIKSLYELQCILDDGKPEGIYTHLGTSDEFSDYRLAIFDKYVQLAKMRYPDILAHCAASANIGQKSARYDMVRAGLVLYADAVKIKTKILDIISVDCGEYIGYSKRKTDKKSKLALIRLGYGDGLPRQLEGEKFVYWKNYPLTCIGVACMDCIYADVTNLDVHIFDEVIVKPEISQFTLYEYLTKLKGRFNITYE